MVASEKQIGGSTTRFTRAFVNLTIAHCRTSGARDTIMRGAAGDQSGAARPRFRAVVTLQGNTLFEVYR